MNICILAKYGNGGQVQFRPTPECAGTTLQGLTKQPHWYANCQKGDKDQKECCANAAVLESGFDWTKFARGNHCPGDEDTGISLSVPFSCMWSMGMEYLHWLQKLCRLLRFKSTCMCLCPCFLADAPLGHVSCFFETTPKAAAAPPPPPAAPGAPPPPPATTTGLDNAPPPNDVGLLDAGGKVEKNNLLFLQLLLYFCLVEYVAHAFLCASSFKRWWNSCLFLT